MRIIYDSGIFAYFLLILFASLFNSKAKKWIRGRKNLLALMKEAANPDETVIWFHCSSLGEFEQGRPVLERLKKQEPDKKILLTFFSPSGFEVRKNYEGADYTFYLPQDTKKNAREFLDIFNIEKAYFVKYEFWYHYLNCLQDRNIPSFLISAIFRENQIFFKKYGRWYKKMLHTFRHIFVQDASSANLLERIAVRNVTVAGDTRFDRVAEITARTTSFPEVNEFTAGEKVIIAGSTWPKDEEILVKYINDSANRIKWIIAPHEIHEENILRLTGSISRKTVRYTEAGTSGKPDAEVMIIDTIGILSHLYKHGLIAYIGGGFGKGIHNTLEAATFGLPVIFGPNYSKFKEAVELISIGAAFHISSYPELKDRIDTLLDSPGSALSAGEKAVEFVISRTGATELIIEKS